MMMTKLVKMSSQEYNDVSRGLDALKSIADQLEEMPELETDEDLKYIWDCANSAYSTVWDFISAYRDQFKA